MSAATLPRLAATRRRPFFVLVRPRDGLLVAAVIAVTQCLLCLAHMDTFVGVWGQTIAEAGTSTVVSAPVAGTLAATIALAHRRGGLPRFESDASIARWKITLRSCTELCCWVLLGFAAGTAPAIALTWRTASYDHFRPWLLLPSLTFLCFAVVIGVAAARLADWLVIPPLVGAGLYALIWWLAVITTPIEHALLPTDELRADLYRRQWWSWSGQTLFWLLLSVALISRLASARRTAFASAWVAGVLGAALLLTNASSLSLDTRAVDLQCRTQRKGIEVCLPTVKSYLLSDYTVAAGRATTELAGLVNRPVLVLDDEAAGTSHTVDRRIVDRAQTPRVTVLRDSQFADISAYTSFNSSQYVIGLASTLIGSETGRYGSDASGRSIAKPSDVLLRWLIKTEGLPTDRQAYIGEPPVYSSFMSFSEPPARAALRWLLSLSPQARERWFAAHRAAIKAGKLRWSDFR